MLKKTFVLFTLQVFIVLLLISNVSADVIPLHIPIIEDSPQQHIFYHELLETALMEDEHTPKLITTELPHLRIKAYMDRGKISIFWMVASNERNKMYIPVETPLTNGLIGKRILLIKKGDQQYYDGVKTLEDFRNMNSVGYMGKKWFDTEVWNLNDLKYLEISGNWKKIFNMIPHGREYNYFSRGLNEIINDIKQYPNLAIEEKLVLSYDRDFYFYLSKTGENPGAKYENFIKHALKRSKENGLIERLVNKYWNDDLKTLNYADRIKIHLKTPE